MRDPELQLPKKKEDFHTFMYSKYGPIREKMVTSKCKSFTNIIMNEVPNDKKIEYFSDKLEISEIFKPRYEILDIVFVYKGRSEDASLKEFLKEWDYKSDVDNLVVCDVVHVEKKGLCL